MTKVDFIESVLCASRGIIKTISKERNIKIQIILCTIIILFALFLEISKTYLITIIIVCFLVIILEMFNNGIEKLIDFISPEYNPQAGKIKDIMAGVVLLTFIMASLVSLLILYNPLINFIFKISRNLLFPISLIFMIIFVLCFIIILEIKIRKDKVKIKKNNFLKYQ
jgi:diacylglycerol kinase